MENKAIERKSADARVVQAVRRLKSTRQKDNLMEVRKNQEDVKHPTIINKTIGRYKTGVLGSVFMKNRYSPLFFQIPINSDNTIKFRLFAYRIGRFAENGLWIVKHS